MDGEKKERVADVLRTARQTALALDAATGGIADFVRAARARREGLYPRAQRNDDGSEPIAREAQSELAANKEELAIADEALARQSEALQATNRDVDARVEQYRRYFDSYPDAYVVTDRSGTIRDANRAAQRLFDFTMHLLAGRAIATLFAPAAAYAVRHAIDRLGNGESASRFDLPLAIDPRGERAAIALRARAEVARDGDAHVTELHWVLREEAAGEGEYVDSVARIAELEATVRALEATVARQQKLIEELAGAVPLETSTAPGDVMSVAEISDLADLTGLRVVVVEDDDDARELLATVLTECGATVLEATNVHEAVRLVERERPDVLVSDIGLPGCTGHELVRQVRALAAEKGGLIPAIALTGYAATDDSREALRVGYQVHVAKPIDPSRLTHAVANVAGVPIVHLTR